MIQSFTEIFSGAGPDLSEHAASDAAIRTLERSLDCAFPGDYRAFLRQYDGGALDDGRVVFYSVDPAHAHDEKEALRRANLSQPAEAPVVLIGFDDDEGAQFGFRKQDVRQPRATAAVYVVADDGELAFGGPSFTEYAQDLARRVAKARERRALPWWKRWFGRQG